VARKRSLRILFTYVLSLLATIALLVVWVVYMVNARASEAGAGTADAGSSVDWPMLAVGCILFFLLIAGLTYQLALTLAARRYAAKQEDFVSNITHELKSPLAGIKLHAQTLERSELSAEQRGRSVSLILKEAERMATLVDNVLESSRLSARKSRLALEPVELSGFLERYLESARARVEGHGVRLTVLGETRAVVRATEEALHRVMTNLLDNAVHFSARGGEVRCRLADGPGRVRIEVEDDGVGIPRGELRKIFDRFYQIGRGLHDRRKGTGLGLAIVSGLVREMKGTVSAYSQEGRPGTRFVVELPALATEARA